jgi:sigma-B regulation protein RsbU (phosphoserine phosphatase)
MTENTKQVLLIEDNPGDADLVRLRLIESRSDVDVSCVSRLSDGLASLEEHSPAIVLLDLNLPDSSGAETFRKILKRAPGVPIVVLSGREDEELALKALHQGVQDYLVKGAFDSKQLARAVRYAVERQALITSLDMSRKQQLQFKDEFLSHVSHELRTPLTCIHQFVTILLDGLAGVISGEQREHLQTALRSVNQLRSMIGDLLEATRAETGKLRVDTRCISVASVIGQTVAMMRNMAAERHVGLEIGADSRVPLVQADPSRVLQVLTCLIDNAIKFTPANGSVIVKACLVDSDSDFVYVSVTDTGRGVSPEARPLIFERLYQDPNAMDGSRKGLGLGLYIARQIVQLHGGRIWVESQLGRGSTFCFTLPLFSLSKVLLPAITNEGCLREALALVTVSAKPSSPAGLRNWIELRQRYREILQRSFYNDRDVVLPPLGDSETTETFLIVASVDEQRTEIMLKRICHQLDQNAELRACTSFELSAQPLTIPKLGTNQPLEKFVDQVADEITMIAMAKLAHSQTSKPAAKHANPSAN